MYRWWTSDTIGVVTGANRGIGFEIVHQLASHGLTVILTSRDAEVGEEAAKVLQEGGLNVVFHQLDIVDPSSIEDFTKWVQENYGGIDILVKALFLFLCCPLADNFFVVCIIFTHISMHVVIPESEF